MKDWPKVSLNPVRMDSSSSTNRILFDTFIIELLDGSIQRGVHRPCLGRGMGCQVDIPFGFIALRKHGQINHIKGLAKQQVKIRGTSSTDDLRQTLVTNLPLSHLQATDQASRPSKGAKRSSNRPHSITYHPERRPDRTTREDKERKGLLLMRRKPDQTHQVGHPDPSALAVWQNVGGKDFRLNHP